MLSKPIRDNVKRPHMLLILAIIFLIGCTGISGRQAKSKMIDVGGHSLNFEVIEGTGQTIILETGQGADSSMWSGVQGILKNTTNYRVISYDRAGFGKSEPGRGNYSIAGEVASLEAGLGRLGVNSSIIYVAHSYGAFLAQEYAARNPGKVRALVLVDPNTACFNNDASGFASVWSPPPYNASAANQRILYAYPAIAQHMANVAPYPDVPTIVITSGKPPVPANLTALWRACHQKLLESKTHGEFWLAENNSHLIAQENPGLVVAAIEKVAHGQ